MNPAQHLYHCNGRERPTGSKMLVQNGYHEFEQNGVKVRGSPRWEWIDTTPAPVCMYDDPKDLAYTGCAHRRNP